jgi:CRISPR/Cas system CSM-associated protein Csm3 (group 7 of RAMP superfamily)
MQTDTLDLTYQIRFTSPFHLGTGRRAGLTQRAVARDSAGYLYVPGSAIKGALRDRATWLANALGRTACEPFDRQRPLHEFAPQPDIVARIFGSRRHPSSLFFDDATMIQEWKDLFKGQGEIDYLARQVQTRGQVSLSRLTGTARSGLLYTSEYGIPNLDFAGHIYGQVTDVPMLSQDTPITYALLLLLTALSSLDRLGGGKTSGAGCVTCAVTGLVVNGASQNSQELLETLNQFEEYETRYELSMEEGAS